MSVRDGPTHVRKVLASSSRLNDSAPSASERCPCGGVMGPLHIQSLLHREWLFKNGLRSYPDETAFPVNGEPTTPLVGDEILDPATGRVTSYQARNRSKAERNAHIPRAGRNLV